MEALRGCSRTSASRDASVSCARTRSARAGATPTSRASRTSRSGRATRSGRSSPRSHDDFFDSLAHSAAVVGINTTAMIEAADRRQERAHGARAGVRAGEHAPLPLPARGERRLPARRLVARRARAAARRACSRTAPRTPSSAAASSSRSSARTGSTGRRRRSSPTRSRSSRRRQGRALAAVAVAASPRDRGRAQRAPPPRKGARRRGPPQRRARALRIAFFAGGPKFVLVEYVPLVRELLATRPRGSPRVHEGQGQRGGSAPGAGRRREPGAFDRGRAAPRRRLARGRECDPLARRPRAVRAPPLRRSTGPAQADGRGHCQGRREGRSSSRSAARWRVAWRAGSQRRATPRRHNRRSPGSRGSRRRFRPAARSTATCTSCAPTSSSSTA